MDASDLQIFEAVARLGGMNKAASALNTVQSNVTARIRALENELGMPLFQRHSRGVSLTPAGQRLLPYAARVHHLLADARRAATDDGTPAGQLVIGSLETTAAVRLSPLLTRFVRRYPAVDFALRTGTSCELLDDVLQSRLDGAFVCGPVTDPALEVQTVFQEEMVVLTAPHIRSLAAVVGQAGVKIVVLRAGCSYRQRLEEILARRGLPNPRRLEFGTLEAIIACVAADLGITLLPAALVGPMRVEGRVAEHPLPPEEALVETVFVRRRDAYRPSALDAFLHLIHPEPTESQAAA